MCVEGATPVIRLLSVITLHYVKVVETRSVYYYAFRLFIAPVKGGIYFFRRCYLGNALLRNVWLAASFTSKDALAARKGGRSLLQKVVILTCCNLKRSNYMVGKKVDQAHKELRQVKKMLALAQEKVALA